MEATQSIQQNVPDGGSKAGKNKGLMALILLVVLLAAAVGGWFWYQSRSRMDDRTKYWFDKYAQDGSLEGRSPQEIQGILNSIVEEGMFNVSINARAVFETGSSKGRIGMENIPQNRYFCRMVLRRDDDQMVLYESQGIKPGQFIDEIELKQILPAGQYPCTAQIIATDPETLDDIGQVHVKINVIILN